MWTHTAVTVCTTPVNWIAYNRFFQRTRSDWGVKFQHCCIFVWLSSSSLCTYVKPNLVNNVTLLKWNDLPSIGQNWERERRRPAGEAASVSYSTWCEWDGTGEGKAMTRARDCDVLSWLRRQGAASILFPKSVHTASKPHQGSLESKPRCSFLGGLSSLIGSSPEFKWAFTPAKRNQTIGGNSPGFI